MTVETSRTRRRSFVVGGVAVAVSVLLVGLFVRSRSVRDDDPAAASPASARVPTTQLHCNFGDPTPLAFDVTTTVTPSTQAMPASHATLWLRPLRPDLPDGWRVAGVVVPRDGFAHPDAMRTPFLLHIAPDCRFEPAGWHADTTSTVADPIVGLLRQFEIVLGDGVASAWDAPQRDVNGTFVARYRRGDEAADGVTVTRALGDYRTRTTTAEVHQTHAAATAVVDAHGHWLRRLDGRARQNITVFAAHLVVDAEYTLVRSESPGDPPDSLATAGDLAAFTLSTPHHVDPVRVDDVRDPDAGPDPLTAVSPATALARVLELFDADQGPTKTAALDYLRRWLRARPGAADELLGLLHGRRLPERLHALAFLALERADTPAARRALVTAIADRSLTDLDRQRGVLALGTTPTGTMESVDALRDLAHSHESGADAEITRGAAMRGLGALATDARPSDVANAARDTIRTAIGSTDADDRRAGIDAAGNSRSAALLPEIRPALTDTDAITRASAASALRGLPPATAQPLLADRLTHETNGETRQAVANSLYENGHGTFPDASVQAAIDTLPTSSPAVRAVLIQVIGAQVPTSRLAHDGLIAWAPHETEAPLIQLIGRYLSLAELRGALPHH